MDHIERAIRCLELHLPSSLRKDNPSLEEAIAQLISSTTGLLATKEGPDTHNNMGDNLRRQLLYLFGISLTASLEYMTSMLSFFHSMKGNPVESVSVQWNWEYLSVSMLSAVLDFLEDRPNNKTREKIALTLFPVMCPNYFIQDPGELIPYHGDLLSTVYQALTAIVVSHPTNVTKFCAEIHRKTLGVTISETKDLLALESLLDLFGCLIPSAKTGRAKRTAFIKDVFDSAIFKHSGESVQAILEDISSPDWNITSEKILKTLASHDLSFPQPFEASKLKINGSCLALSAPCYIDAKQFVANIEKDGGIETCCVPFSTVLDVSSLESLKSENVSVTLSKPPLLGNKPISIRPTKSIVLSWIINESQFSRFSEALRARNIKTSHSIQGKWSKVKPVALDFFPAKKDPHDLTRERLHQLSQSWTLNSTPKLDKGCIKEPETSPLAPDFARTNDVLLKVDTKYLNGNDSASPAVTVAGIVNTSLGVIANGNAGTKSNNIHLRAGQASYASSREALCVKSENEHVREEFESPIVSAIASSTDAILPSERRHLQRNAVTAPPSVIEDTELVKKRSITHLDFDELAVDHVYVPKRRRLDSTPSSPVPVPKTVKYTSKKVILSPESEASLVANFHEILVPISEENTTTRVGKNAGRLQEAKQKKPSTSRKKGTTGKEPIAAKEADLLTETERGEINLCSADAPKVLRRSTRGAKPRSPTPIVRQSPKKVGKDASVEPETELAPRRNVLESTRATPTEQTRLANITATSPFIAIASHQSKLSLEPKIKGSRSDHQLQVLNTAPNSVMIDLTAGSPSPVSKSDRENITKGRDVSPGSDESIKVARIGDVLSDDLSFAAFNVGKINARTSPKKWRAFSMNITSFNTRLTFDRAVDTLTAETAVEVDTGYQTNRTPAGGEDDVPCTPFTFSLHRSRNLRYNTKKILLNKLPKKPIFEVPDQDGTRRVLRPPQINQVPRPERKDLTSKKTKHDPMQKIIAVVQHINKAVVQNIEHRFENITENLNSGQRQMLEESATGLREIYHDSVQYFNDMVDLEENYTSQCSNFNAALHDYIKSSEQVAHTFQSVTLEHGRRTLSKSFRPTLFSKKASIPKLS